MTSRERLEAAMRGDPVDRVPIWVREGFAVHEPPAGADDFRCGWQAAPVYRELLDYVKPHVDEFVGWGMSGFNRALMVPPRVISGETIEEAHETIRRRTTLDTPAGPLHGISEVRRDVNTDWTLKHAVESEEDLHKLASVPFAIDPATTEQSLRNYRRARDRAAGQYLVRSFISSPIVIISGCMDFQLFLEMSFTHRKWFHELLEETTRRCLALLEAIFDAEEIDSAVTLGGSEQCTPPMMAPTAFDEYVVPYDGAIIRFLKSRGCLVQVHCHGKVRHALECMIEMGVDATEPVEPPPAGDVTYAEARATAGDRLTLMGNLEFDMLESAEPAQIRQRVKEILAHGNRRLILGASAGPISAVSRRLADNYKAWIDTALEHG